MARRLSEYIVRVRETRLMEYVVEATDKKDAMARVEQGEGEPCPGAGDRVDLEAEHAERNV